MAGLSCVPDHSTTVSTLILVQDFDGGLVGSTLSQALSQSSSLSKVSWEVKPASMFPRGVVDVVEAVRNQETWVALTG